MYLCAQTHLCVCVIYIWYIPRYNCLLKMPAFPCHQYDLELYKGTLIVCRLPLSLAMLTLSPDKLPSTYSKSNRVKQ